MKLLSASLLLISLSLTSAHAAEVLNCNNGALTVTPSATTPNRFDISVNDIEIVKYFLYEIQKSETNYVQNTKISNKGVMTISNAMFTRNGAALVTGQFGPELRFEGKNAKLVINKVKMTSSRSYEHHEIANWYFNACR